MRVGVLSAGRTGHWNPPPAWLKFLMEAEEASTIGMPCSRMYVTVMTRVFEAVSEAA